MVFCSDCGFENNDDASRCEECGSYLIKGEFFSKKDFTDFDAILANENLLEIEGLSVEIYDMVIQNIKDMGKSSLNESGYHLSTLDKIKKIVGVYTKINYKSRGAELGSYAFNSIQIDDRLDDSNQISTLLHELAHHLFSEIFEQILMYLWGCGKSDTLEALVWFILTPNRLNILSNEYCAHTCEGRFIPHGYQNYGSFNGVLALMIDEQLDEEIIKSSIIFGNTIAQDIIGIFEEFIDDSLREEIKRQFKKDYVHPPTYDEILLEFEEVYDDKSKIEYVINVLKAGFELAHEADMMKVLNEYKNGFNDDSH